MIGKIIKGKLVSVLNKVPHRKDVWESGGTAPRIFNLSTRW